MAKLQCVQTHRVQITDRGGKTLVVTPRDLSRVSWNRRLSAMSTASFRLEGAMCDSQVDEMRRIMTRRHEMVIFREQERVWEGPVMGVTWDAGGVTVNAADVMQYLQGRPLTKWWPNSEDGGPANATTRIQQIINYELATNYTAPNATPTLLVPAWENVTPEANVLPFVEIRPGTLLVSVETLPFQMMLAEHLLALAKMGLNFTVLGRKILIWDSKQEIGRLQTLTASDWNGDPTVYDDGTEFTAIQHVVGQPEGGSDPTDTYFIGSAGVSDSVFGPWARLDSHQDEDSDLDITDAVKSQAQQLIVGRNPVPLELRTNGNASIQLSPTLTLDSLVPGTTVPIRGTFSRYALVSLQQLQEVTVDESAAGESIQIKLGTQGEEAGA